MSVTIKAPFNHPEVTTRANTFGVPGNAAGLPPDGARVRVASFAGNYNCVDVMIDIPISPSVVVPDPWLDTIWELEGQTDTTSYLLGRARLGDLPGLRLRSSRVQGPIFSIRNRAFQKLRLSVYRPPSPLPAVADCQLRLWNASGPPRDVASYPCQWSAISDIRSSRTPLSAAVPLLEIAPGSTWGGRLGITSVSVVTNDAQQAGMMQEWDIVDRVTGLPDVILLSYMTGRGALQGGETFSHPVYTRRGASLVATLSNADAGDLYFVNLNYFIE